MDLDSMKYAELRSIAKGLGLKANMKADKLLKAIKQHYQQVKDVEEGVQDAIVEEGETAQQDKEASRVENVASPAVFVNTRRGKGTKRKISDPATVPECDAQPHPDAPEGDSEVTASRPPCGGKKRKVSHAKDFDKTEEPQTAVDEQQPDIKDEQQPDIKDEQQPDIDEAPVHDDADKAPNVARAGKIPRLQGRLQQKNKPLLKPVTPNFKKLHAAHFDKMESIDSYVQRKNKQMETFRTSVKELKKLSDKNKLQQADGKTQARNRGRASLLSPVPVNKRPVEDRRTMLSASKAPPNKPAGKEAAPFRPSVLSTRRINVRFSEATFDNENKRSLVKTPARMSLCVASSTPQKQAADAGKPKTIKTSTFSATKTPGAFLFTGNTSTSTTPATQKKTNFDLKASLSRPLGYKPHTGKLKPFADAKENETGNKSLISNSHQKNYKQHQVQTRGDRRVKHLEDRKQKKENLLGARRGLVMM